MITPPHIAGKDNGFVDVAPAIDRVGDFAALLGEAFDEAMSYAALRKAESVGRPTGSKEWLADMERRTGMILTPRKPGPAPRQYQGDIARCLIDLFIALFLNRVSQRLSSRSSDDGVAWLSEPS